MTFTIAALLVTWGAILILTMALAGVLRQLRTLAATGTLTPRVLMGPPLGAAAPPLPAAESLPKPVVLLFADRDCPGCAEVVPAFANGFAPGTSKLVIYSGEATDSVGGALPRRSGSRVQALEYPGHPVLCRRGWTWASCSRRTGRLAQHA